MHKVSTQINITGTGIISPVGDSVSSCYNALINKQTGIGKAQFLQTIHRDTFPLGEVKFSNDDLLQKAGVAKAQAHQHTRASLMAIIAIKEAIAMAGISTPVIENCALVSATSVGGMDKTENCYNNAQYSSTDYIYTHSCGDATDRICEYLNINGYRTTLSTACSSGANALIHGAMLIQNGLADCVIAGGTDPLCKFTLNGFNTLMILDKDPCHPFTHTRNGLNLGEGAAYLVLESDDSVKRNGSKVLCRLTGFSNVNDAFHQTASSPNGEGAYGAMHKALEMAGLAPSMIDYINVHGTGTQNNDLTEGIALKRVFGETIPPFSSTKSLTGHTLGAAAALEAVFSVLSLVNDVLLPQINFTEPLEETGLIPVTEPLKGQVNHVLSNSFGFGGNNSSLIFSK